MLLGPAWLKAVGDEVDPRVAQVTIRAQFHSAKRHARYHGSVKLTIDLDREEDGRWIAKAMELPGVMCYGQTRDAVPDEQLASQ